ncbi:MAG: type III secretion system chaperone [Succinimonas sp.]|nr:type III secretion system chaperone [Succinimonas sp.]
MSLSQAKILMTGLAKMLGVQGDVMGDDGMCTVTLEQPWMPPVHIVYIDSDNSMLFFAEIGILETERETEILKELMQRQYLFSGTNGVTASLSGDNNMLTAQFKFGLAELTESDLAFHLNNFAGEAACMKLLVYGEELGAQPEKPDDSADAGAVPKENFLAI